MLYNKFRDQVAQTDIRETLHEIYKSIDFNFELEYDVLEEIRNELVQEEMEW